MKKLLTILFVLLGAFALVACGPTEDPTDPTDPTDPSQTVTVPTTPSEQVTVPKTGEQTTTPVYAILIVLAGVALLLLLVWRRRLIEK